MVSRNLGPGDPPGLVLTAFALSGVCLVTNAGNPVPGLTRAQVQDLVAGRVTNWSQVPGSTRTDAIVPVALDLTAGARLVFESVFVDVSDTDRLRAAHVLRRRAGPRLRPSDARRLGVRRPGARLEPARDDLRGRALRARHDPLRAPIPHSARSGW